MKKLEAFFKHKENTQDKDDGKNNTFGEYWEFQELDEVELWNIELDTMMGRSYFVQMFKNSLVLFPISYNERIKDILFESGGIVLMHCVTTIEDQYIITICMDYSKSPFNLTVFLKSLENSDFRALMKEIEE